MEKEREGEKKRDFMLDGSRLTISPLQEEQVEKWYDLKASQ